MLLYRQPLRLLKERIALAPKPYVRLCGHAPVASYLAPYGYPALLMAVSHICHSPLFPVQALIMLCGAHSSDLPLRRKANACAWSVFA